MAATWSAVPWVDQHQGRVGFAVQAFPNDTPTDKARHLLAAGRLAEALGLDGFFLGDHRGWMLDPWPHLGALAVATERARAAGDQRRLRALPPPGPDRAPGRRR
jgi:hypothetical protein